MNYIYLILLHGAGTVHKKHKHLILK